MKIGIVCYPTFGGSGVLATELGKALATKGHFVHFITYRQPVRLSEFSANIFYHEVPVPEYPLFDYPPYELALASTLVDVVLKYNLDLLHVHYAIPHASAACMAKQIAKDGEGATKFIEVTVEGAKRRADARVAAKTIAGSSLVKAAIYGKDANWGRVLCALGYSGADFDPDIVDMFFGDLQMMDQGRALVFDEQKALAYLENKEIRVVVNLHQGVESSTAWGCDLTHDYVTINGSYRS